MPHPPKQEEQRNKKQKTKKKGQTEINKDNNSRDKEAFIR